MLLNIIYNGFYNFPTELILELSSNIRVDIGSGLFLLRKFLYEFNLLKGFVLAYEFSFTACL